MTQRADPSRVTTRRRGKRLRCACSLAATILLTVLAAFHSIILTAEERFVGDDDLSGQREIIDASHAWHVTDDGLKRLRSYVLRGEIDIYMQNKVRVLKLDSTQVTDAGLAQLDGDDGLIYLQELSLADTPVGDAGLMALFGLQRLRHVNLGRSLVFPDGVSGPRVTPAGITRLRMALPDCRVEHHRESIELTKRQRAQFRIWSTVAEPRVNAQGDIIALFLRRDARLTPDHRSSLPQLQHLRELYAAGMFTAGDVALLPALGSLRELCLRGCVLDDDDIKPLAKVVGLQVLDLSGTRLTDRGLDHLQSLDRLTAVDMRGTLVRTRGLQRLRESLPRTEFVFDPSRVVQLPYPRLTVNDQFELLNVGHLGSRSSRASLLQQLTELLDHPTLEQISLRHADNLGDENLKTIARMSNLKQLDLGNTKVTAAGLQYLAPLKRLQKIDLWHTQVRGDGGLSALIDLRELESLELDETDIDDTALALIARMKSLRYVELWHTDVTRDGVARLQQSRPDLEIKSNPRN